jgi:hypothetical protein
MGGGIGGLYVAYQILKRAPHLRVLVLEKSDYLGGRVFTYSDSFMSVETGAGRFNEKHVLFMGLLKEFGLFSKRVKNDSSVGYYHVGIETKGEIKGKYMNSVLDSLVLRNSELSLTESFTSSNLELGVSSVLWSGVELLIDSGLDILLDSNRNGGLPNVGLIVRVLAASVFVSKKKLISMTFIDFARTVLSKQEVDFLLGSFGYYSELVVLNAYDCIHLILELDPKNHFYSLRDGLSQVIDELVRRIRKMGGLVLTGKFVKRVREVDIEKGVKKGSGARDRDRAGVGKGPTEYILEGVGVRGGGFSYRSKAVVSSLTKRALEGITFFKPLMSLLKPIVCAPLCRIYAKYPVGIESSGRGSSGSGKGRVWFSGISKFTVNNALRMVIPVSEKEGVIMIAYSDNKFARFWKELYDRDGKKGVHLEIRRLILESVGISIPDPIALQVFYWDCGVGYWGVGSDSKMISDAVVQPFSGKSVYICGENFSTGHQQWMEGALETGAKVVSKIFSM